MALSTKRIAHEAPRVDRRRHSRFPLGLPVDVHLGRRKTGMIVELADVSVGGLLLRGGDGDVAVAETAAIGFVGPDRKRCVAKGRVVRIDDGGQFVVKLDTSNDAFRGFVGLLTGQA
jgi:hypothetical protein